MEFDFHYFTEHINSMASVFSVEVFPDGSYGNIRLVTGNAIFFKKSDDDHEKIGEDALYKTEFSPDEPYENYMPKDKNFEEFCYRSAIQNETLHTYIHPERMPMWLHLTAIPLKTDKPNIGYCAFVQSFSEAPDYSLMSNTDPVVSANVLQICMRLRGSNEFKNTIHDVISDIRKMCKAEHCCILETDSAARKCSVLCEALSEDTKLSSLNKYVHDDFYDVVDTWHGTIAGSTCVIIKDEKDWEDLKRSNPVWYNSIKPTGAKNIVLFPLKYHDETLGYIWAVNFDADKTLKIKEMLELSTYYIASELAGYKIFNKLEILNSKDMLTGILNRNAMNNRVDTLIAEGKDSSEPVCIIFADLNGLKQVNDNDGHFAGDLLLKDAALTLQKHFPEYEIYRAGGDEFMVLAMVNDRAKLEKQILKFKKATETPDGGVCFAVGWSYSTVCDIRTALHEADVNMYADKEEYYNKYPERRR